MHADSIISFKQEDEDAYHLVFEDDDGETRTLTMGGMEALRLYGLIISCVNDYYAEMQAALASYKRGEGPNGEPRGTWEDEDIHSVRADLLPHYGARLRRETAAEYADYLNKARKENP